MAAMADGLRPDELVEDRWYRVKVTRPGGLLLGAPDTRRDVRLAAGQEMTLVWHGDGGDGYRWRGGQKVPTAGTFWTSSDIDAALIVYFEDLAVLAEAPAPWRR